MSLPRRLLPELLDSLPHHDPSSLRSRADLRRLNHLLGNFAWFRSRLARLLRTAPETPIVELGAGDGSLAHYLLRHFPSLSYTGLDLAPQPSGWPPGLSWCRGDVFAELPRLNPAIVLANHFLHHFDEAALRRLGEILHASPTRLILTSEPARLTYTRCLSRLSPFLILNHVTRHDMRISIDAGFRTGELPGALFSSGTLPVWATQDFYSPLGACRMIAERPPHEG